MERKFECYGGGEPFEAFKDSIMLKLNKWKRVKSLNVKTSRAEANARTDMQRCQSMEEYSKALEANVYPANHERPEPDAIEFAQRRAKLEGKRE